MNQLVEKLITNIICTTFFILYTQELNWVQNNSILLDSILNLKKKNKIITPHFSPKKITVTSTIIVSSHESGKNFITWTRPASTTIISNNHVSCKRKGLPSWRIFFISRKYLLRQDMSSLSINRLFLFRYLCYLK
jgi:hypothetical protein